MDVLSLTPTVVSTLVNFPMVQTLLDSLIVDASQIGNMIFLSIHGVFKEESGDVRGFSRVFHLRSSTPEEVSPCGCFIINDHLVIREVDKQGSFGAGSASSMPWNGAGSSSGSGSGGGFSMNSVIQALRRETGMNEEYCRMCLEKSAWDLSAAKALFAQFRHDLGPEAFS